MSLPITKKIKVFSRKWKNLSRHQQYRLRLMTIYTGYMKAFATQHATDIFVATYGKKYIGWAAVDKATNNFMIYVLEPYRNMGVGKRLFKKAYSSTKYVLNVYPWSDESDALFNNFANQCKKKPTDELDYLDPFNFPRIQNMGKANY